MKRLTVFILTWLIGFQLFSQQTVLHLYSGKNVIFEKSVTELDSIKFSGFNSIYNYGNEYMTFPVGDIDSLIFSFDTLRNENGIYIVYNGNQVSVTNPLKDNGVSITVEGAKVAVVAASGLTDVEYHLSGQTDTGSFSINSDKRFSLCLEGVSITNPKGPAIEVSSDKKMNVLLRGTTKNTLTDGDGNSKKAAFQSKGQMIFNGNGKLTVNGKAKHAIFSNDYVQINGGDITVASAKSDGIHSDYFVMNDGSLSVRNIEGDAVDGDAGYIEINGGQLDFNISNEDSKGLKCDSTITINDGEITMTLTGNQSKGLKSGQTITVNNGVIHVTASGSVVLEAEQSGYNPSYCIAVKADSDIVVNGGEINLTCTSTNKGGKGLSADRNLMIYGGKVDVSTAGAGAVYTNESGYTDSYTACCITADGNISLMGGVINCSSTGSGGKGVKCDGMMTLGKEGADNDVLKVTVKTSGERFLVSGTSGGGGGRPGGGGPGEDGGDYANPKAIKSEGNMIINSGTFNVTCSQQQEGGEGIESKAVLTVNGGDFTMSTYDDCINAATQLNINGGTFYCVSNGNDAIDCNGPLAVTGGFVIANGSRSPEEGLDCDNYGLTITGGVVVATGGGASTNFKGGQKVIKYSGAGNRAIQILNAQNKAILTYQLPSSTSGGLPGGPGGGGNAMVMIFTDPQLTAGTYTLKYGGTITGGTNYHGYYKDATYSGGSSKTFTISTSQMTSVTVY